jgi:hypothetical protein
MRAKEFIAEHNPTGKPHPNAKEASRGLHKFRDINAQDRIYELNRVMMAVACTDGKIPVTLDSESYTGRNNTAHPYTKEEQDMLKIAYAAVGSEVHDLNNGDMRSLEVKDTNKTSPIQAFKGFK